MAFVHGKSQYISIDGNDVSEYANNVQLPREADTHDVTTFGNTSHRFVGGLKTGTCTVQGIYDNTETTGPAAALEPLLGETVEVIYRPEGTGSGLPEKTFNAVLQTFELTAPVADMITWQCELQIDGDVTLGAQA